MVRKNIVPDVNWRGSGVAMDLGKVVSESFSMVFRRFWKLLGLFVLFTVLQWVISSISLLGIGFSVFSQGFDPGSTGPGLGAVTAMGIFYTVYLVFYAAQSLAMTHQASALLQPSFGDSVGVGLKAFLTALGLTLIYVFAYLAIFSVGGLLMASAGPNPALAVIAGIGMLAAFVLSIWLWCRMAVTLPVVAVEGERNPIAAIKRSWVLTRGHALKILLAYIAFAFLFGIVVFMIFAIAGGTFASITGLGQENASTGGFIIGMLVVIFAFFALFGFFIMVASSFMAALHTQLAGRDNLAETFG